MKSGNEDHSFSLTAHFSDRARDFDDLQHEIAGRDVGRIARFLPDEARGAQSGSKRRAQREEALTNLQIMLMNDPGYAELHRNTMNRLAAVETATEAALRNARARLEETRSALDDVLARAARHDDQPVFRDELGQIRDLEGTISAAEDLDGLHIPQNAPSYEEYAQHQQDVDEASAERDAITLYQIDVLGAARDRLSDPDNPPTTEELEAIGRHLEEAMPSAVRPEIDAIIVEAPPPPAGTPPVVPRL